MEGTQGQLGTWLTNALGGNYPYRRVEVNHIPPAKVSPVAVAAGAVLGAAADRRADVNPGYAGGNNLFCLVLANLLIAVNNDFLGLGVDHLAGS